MIGIFDSGLGGLTVVRAVRERLPASDILFFSDQAHVPYGERAPDDLYALLDANLPLLATEVPMRAGFQNAVTAGMPLVRYEPAHPGATAMRRLAAELQRITPPALVGQ